MSSWFKWPSWLKKKKKVYEIPPEIDEAALTSRLDQCLRTHVKFADTPCDVDHGWKLESSSHGVKVYTACKPRKQFGLTKSSSNKVIKTPEPPPKGEIPAAISSPSASSSSAAAAAASSSASSSAAASSSSAAAAAAAAAATESSVSEEVMDSESLKAEAVKEGLSTTDDGDTDSQTTCCKTVGAIEGVCAAEAMAAWWTDCWDISAQGKPPDNLQMFSKFYRIRHQITESVGWGISDRCSIFAARALHLDPQADRYIVQALTVRHKKHPEEQTKKLKQILTKLDIAVIFQTEFKNGKTKNSLDLTRADVRTVLNYQAEFDPGGVAPLWIVRIFARKAYPTFINGFIQHCHKCFDDMPLQLSDVAPLVGNPARHQSMAEFEALYEAEAKQLADEDAGGGSAAGATAAAADNAVKTE